MDELSTALENQLDEWKKRLLPNTTVVLQTAVVAGLVYAMWMSAPYRKRRR